MRRTLQPSPGREPTAPSPGRAAGRAGQMDAGAMTLLMGGLQRLAMRYDLALLLVDHHQQVTTRAQR